jgi:hypothetical protein
MAGTKKISFPARQLFLTTESGHFFKKMRGGEGGNDGGLDGTKVVCFALPLGETRESVSLEKSDLLLIFLPELLLPFLEGGK